MLYIDVKYANLLGSHLRNYKKRGDFLWNFSCPICGDSSKNKLKARGYIYKMKVGLAVKCHNCSYSANIGNFIKQVNPNLYEEYVLDNYKESGAPRSSHKDESVAVPDIIKTPELSDSVLDPLTRIDKLPPDHPAVRYCLQRKIPTKFFGSLYFCRYFKKYVNSVAYKFSNEDDDHPRLIIPYFNSYGKCFAFQGRAFGKEEPKYFTIKLDEHHERIYGLDRLNYAKRVYITEGPLDSLFIPNAIAVSGSTFNMPTIKSLMSNATIIFDNEPRSKEITKLIKDSIESGYSVCLWPETIREKDINEMIMNGRTSEEILDIIDNNTYNGISATLRLAEWRKC